MIFYYKTWAYLYCHSNSPFSVRKYCAIESLMFLACIGPGLFLKRRLMFKKLDKSESFSHCPGMMLWSGPSISISPGCMYESCPSFIKKLWSATALLTVLVAFLGQSKIGLLRTRNFEACDKKNTEFILLHV